MSKGFDWERTQKENLVRARGHQPHEDFLPRGDRPKPHKKKKKKGASDGRKLLATRRAYKVGYSDLLDFVADSVACNHWVSDMVPVTVTKELAREVENAGGLLSWAKKQKSFKARLSRAKKIGSRRWENPK